MNTAALVALVAGVVVVLALDHAPVVEHYRAAHDIALRHERREANTEDLRQALVHYRALFSELFEEGVPAQAGVSP